MTKQIRDSIDLIPLSQAETELFQKLCDIIDNNRDLFESAVSDVVNKYTDPSAVTKNVVSEVFIENGLPSVVNLFDTFETIDYNTILAFSSYILLLKGNRVGYELVLRLLGFEYAMSEWWEQTPKGKPNTFSIDIDLNTSLVNKPYETFQKIKKFTSEYVFPKIDPLGYTITIELAETGWLCIGINNPSYNSYVDIALDEALLFSNTRFILVDSTGQKWNIKVNNFGQIGTFKTDIGTPTHLFSLYSEIDSPRRIEIDTDGNLYSLPGNLETHPIIPSFSIASRDNTNWYFNIDEDGIVYVSLSPYIYNESDYILLENGFVILTENGDNLLT